MNIYYDVEDNHYRTYPDGDIATIDQMRELIENKNVSIVKLQQENKILKENAEHNDKVVDKVNWENQLLKKENKQLKDNWEIIRQYCLDEQVPEESDEYNSYIEFSNSVYDNILNKMQELEQGSDSNE